MGIKFATHPIQQVLVFWVVWITEGLQEIVNSLTRTGTKTRAGHMELTEPVLDFLTAARLWNGSVLSAGLCISEAGQAVA